MSEPAAIRLLVADRSVLAALRFALSIEGFAIADEDIVEADPCRHGTLVIDERYDGDGLTVLAELRARNCRAAAIVLATNPTARLRALIAGLNASLVEKPLLGDDLSRAILSANETRKVA